MGRFQRSLDIAKTSFKIVKEEKELIIFPILSIIFSSVFLLIIAIPFLLTSFLNSSSSSGFSLIHIIMLFIIYFGLAVIATFFNFCVVYTAAEKFSNNEARFRKTISFAFTKIPQIIKWALLSATVGVLLAVIKGFARKAKGVGSIALSFFGWILSVSWSIATIFVIPIMVYKNLGPISAVRESISTLKKTWGEKIIGTIGIGLISFIVILIEILIALIITIPLFFLSVTIGVISAVIFLLIIISTFILFGIAGQIYDTALYVYAETGIVVSDYNEEDLKGAFKIKEL